MSLDIFFRKHKPDSDFDEDNDYLDNWIGSYPANVTHNCNKCAAEVKLKTPEKIKDNIYQYTELTLFDVLWRGNEHNIIQAKEMIPYVKEGLNELINNVKFYQQFDSPNGYGNVFSLIRFCVILLACCKDYPEAYLEFSR